MTSDKKRASEGVLKVTRDDELQRDLDAARERTGIRSEADLVRYALRQVARNESETA